MSSSPSERPSARPFPLSLIALTPSLLRDLQDDLDSGLATLRIEVGAHRDWVAALVGHTASMPEAPASSPHWGGYMAVDAERRLAGFCAFKAPPNARGEVEIAYTTVADREGRGIATAMAAALIDLVRTEQVVVTVLAHTLPEVNASGRILTKLGFARRGTVIDPEDGPVWRWELPIER